MGGTTSKPTTTLEKKEEKTRYSNTKNSTTSSSTAVVLSNSSQSTRSSSSSSDVVSKTESKASEPKEVILSTKEGNTLIKTVFPSLTTIPNDLISTILQYDGSSTWLDQSLFKKVYSTQKDDISFHVAYAGSLDQLKNYIDNYHKTGESKKLLLNETFTINGMQGTLIQLAMIGLDQTIRNDNGEEIDGGMAEWLMNLIQKEYPEWYDDAIAQAKKAAPEESKEEKTERESISAAAVENLFEVFIKGDKTSIEKAINTFAEFVQGIKTRLQNEKGYLTNNRYYLNLLHLVYCAFDVLARRGEELDGKWYGKAADQFCFKIIGDILESKFPPRLRQILKSGIYNLLDAGKKAARDIDMTGNKFNVSSSNYLLGVNFYYDLFGACARGRTPHSAELAAAAFIKTYYNNYVCTQNLFLSTHSQHQAVTLRSNALGL